jgi:adenine-specific DNA-methyltransferase
MYIKDEYKSKLSYEFLLGLLNSRLYEFYFKSFGKKLGDNLYDYYPNTVMKLMVPVCDDGYISSIVRELMNTDDKNIEAALMGDIDKYVYRLFGMSDAQIGIIEGRLSRL